jgi:hypothetical protein
LILEEPMPLLPLLKMVRHVPFCTVILEK